MRVEVFLPVMGETMDDGAVAVWLAHTGDHVRKGQVIAEIETNKAVFDLEAPCAGVLRVLVRSEQMVPVLTALAVVETDEPEEERAPIPALQAALAVVETDEPAEAQADVPAAWSPPAPVPLEPEEVAYPEPTESLTTAREDAAAGAAMLEAMFEAAMSDHESVAALGQGTLETVAESVGPTDSQESALVAPAEVEEAPPAGELEGDAAGSGATPVDQETEVEAQLSPEQALMPEEALSLPAAPEPPATTVGAPEHVDAMGTAPEPADEPESLVPELPVPEAPVAPVAPPAIEEPPVRSFVSPRARRLARELSVAEDDVQGSGPGGRVEERDVRRWSESRPPDRGSGAGAGPGDAANTNAGESGGAITAMRLEVAACMSRSARTTTPVTLMTEADATELVALRKRLNSEVGRAGAVEISYDALLVRLAALALAEHPRLNARSTENGVETVAQINMGVATDTPRGLLVPVLRDAGGMDLWRIAAELAELTSRARAGASGPDELGGGTFTIMNLGAYGVDAFTPIINWPECATLGVGRIVAKPAVHQGQVVARQLVTLSLTFDHGAMDESPAARFLQRLVQLIQLPEGVLK